MPIDKHESRAWRQRIRDILNRDRDPIGGCPDDEYEAYVGKIAAMIRAKATDDELLRYLEWVEAEHMGFGKFDLARARNVISVIRTLGPAP